MAVYALKVLCRVPNRRRISIRNHSEAEFDPEDDVLDVRPEPNSAPLEHHQDLGQVTRRANGSAQAAAYLHPRQH
jgi:hypothetical protein